MRKAPDMAGQGRTQRREFGGRLALLLLGTCTEKEESKLTLDGRSVKRELRFVGDEVKWAEPVSSDPDCKIGWATNGAKNITGSTPCKQRATGALVRQSFEIGGRTRKLVEEKADGSLLSNYDDEYEYLK